MKAPAFQLFAADFYMDTNDWTIDEIGIYTRLLLSEWVNGDLPNDEKRLARIAGTSIKKFSKGWSIIKKKFIQNGEGRFQNLRLEESRIKQSQYIEKQREKGKASAQKRWEKPITTVITTAEPQLQPTHQPDCNSSSSSSIITPIVPLKGDDVLSLEKPEPKSHPPYQEIRNLWIKILPELPTPHAENKTWYPEFKARWFSAEKRQDLDYWRDFFLKVRTNPHWMGQNERGWKATMQWVFKATNFFKIIERKE